MNEPHPEKAMNRREFLGRSVKAGLSIAAAGSIAYWLYDKQPPRPSTEAAATVTLPDFSVAGTAGRLAIVAGSDRASTVARGIEAVGGIAAFIKRGDRVLLKVNAAFASPAALSATTHPELITAVARLCLRAGAASVVVTDNPINDPKSCFTLTGIEEAARSGGARVMLPQDNYFQPVTVPGAALIRNWPLLHEPFRGVTKLIGIAPVKDHFRSGASMTMKNWYGLLGGRRNVFHQNIHDFIKELALMVRPTLVILDGTTTMMHNGPTGGSLDDLKPTRVMIVSTDQVAADAFGATLLGKTAAHLPYITKAAAAGLGTADFESLHPVRVEV